jgi:hypothetical protein
MEAGQGEIIIIFRKTEEDYFSLKQKYCLISRANQFAAIRTNSTLLAWPRFGAFVGKADTNQPMAPAETVENDPEPTFP